MSVIEKVLSLVSAHRDGILSWDDMILRFPEDEEYADEDVSELLDLLEHEPAVRGSRSARLAWERRTNALIVLLGEKIGGDVGQRRN